MEAKDYLVDDVTLVVLNHYQIHTSNKRGIVPVLDFLNDHSELLVGSDIADRVIGKASAMLLAKGNVASIYAEVLSEKAIPILEEYGIPYEYETLTEYIVNREKTGICPMEQTVQDIDDLDVAKEALEAKVLELRSKHD